MRHDLQESNGRLNCTRRMFETKYTETGLTCQELSFIMKQGWTLGLSVRGHGCAVRVREIARPNPLAPTGDGRDGSDASLAVSPCPFPLAMVKYAQYRRWESVA